MGTPRVGRLVGIALLGALVTSGCAWLERSSVSSAPANTQADGASGNPSVSRSGRYVAFDSTATNLVAGDTNGVADVFVRDNVTKLTERISVSSSEAQATGASRAPSISDNGRYVAFESVASDLTADGDAASDVFVRDRVAGTTTLVSVNDDETAITDRATVAVISGDGSTVAFQTFTVRQIIDVFPIPQGPLGPFVRHVAAATTRLMSPNSVSGYFFVSSYDLSDDGSRIISTSVNVQGFTSRAYIGDTITGTINPAFAATTILPASYTPTVVAISGDGNRFAHAAGPTTTGGTVGTLIVGSTVDPAAAAPISTPAIDRLFLSTTGTTIGANVHILGGVSLLVRPVGRVAWAITNQTADGKRLVETTGGAMSADGRWVSFPSTDPQLVANDTNSVADVFTRSVKRSEPPPTPS